jgi:hypothetical protein
VYRQQSVNGLDLHYHQPFHHQIEPIATMQRVPLILKAQWVPLLERNMPKLELPAETRLVCRL